MENFTFFYITLYVGSVKQTSIISSRLHRKRHHSKIGIARTIYCRYFSTHESVITLELEMGHFLFIEVAVLILLFCSTGLGKNCFPFHFINNMIGHPSE